MKWAMAHLKSVHQSITRKRERESKKDCGGVSDTVQMYRCDSISANYAVDCKPGNRSLPPEVVVVLVGWWLGGAEARCSTKQR